MTYISFQLGLAICLVIFLLKYLEPVYNTLMSDIVNKIGKIKSKVIINTISQLVGKFFTGGATLITTLLIARFLGASGYGDYIKITSIVAIFYLFADFGINANYLKIDPDNQTSNSNWSSLLVLRFLMGLGLIFLLLVILIFLPGNSQTGYSNLVKLGIIFYCPTILFQALITTANALFQKYFRYDLASLAIGVGSVVTLFFVLLAVRIFNPDVALHFIIIFSGIGSLVSALTGLWLIRRFATFKFEWNFKLMKQMFFTSIPLGVTLVFNLIYFRADNFILTMTRSTTEVGLYGFAYKIFEFPLVIPTFFMNSVYPVMLSKIVGKSDANLWELKNVLVKSLWFLVPCSLIVTAVIYFGAPLLTIVKPEFSGSVVSLKILSLGLPFFFLSSLTMWTIIVASKQIQLIYIYGGSMLVNILANIFFIPKYGYIAASWITVWSEGLVLLISAICLYNLYTKKTKL
jgi:O-antigen/teichoic acid export membrane protein